MIQIKRGLGTLILIPYFIMVACALMLPSDGYHGLLSPKSLSFLATAYTFSLYVFVRNQLNFEQLRLIIFTLGATSFLMLWLIFGLMMNEEGFGPPFDQFKVFIITLVFTVTTIYLVSDNVIKGQTVLKSFIWTNLLFSLTKVTIVALHLLDIVPLWKFMEWTGVRFMSMQIMGGLSRLQLSVDIITPFLIYFVLQSRALDLKFGRTFKCFYCFISLISVFLSFSRVLIFVAFISFFFYWLSLHATRLFRFFILFIGALFGLVLWVGIDNVAEIIHVRLFSTDAHQSDDVRGEQIEALMGEFEQRQLLGKGLGGSVPSYLRDSEVTHSYEVQWVAFLMQFGLIGLPFVLIPLCIIAAKFLIRPITRVNLGFLGLFLIWLAAGFTNPYLISLTSGVVYSAFFLAGRVGNSAMYDTGST